MRPISMTMPLEAVWLILNMCGLYSENAAIQRVVSKRCMDTTSDHDLASVIQISPCVAYICALKSSYVCTNITSAVPWIILAHKESSGCEQLKRWLTLKYILMKQIAFWRTKSANTSLCLCYLSIAVTTRRFRTQILNFVFYKTGSEYHRE